jgi:hypothetical protein
VTGLDGGADWTRVLYGADAQHVPAWMYVQDQGDSTVSFVGSSRVAEGRHPLRYGTDYPHQFIVGELILRPHVVIGTRALLGTGLGGLATSDHDTARMLGNGALLVGTVRDLERLQSQSESRRRAND